MKAENSHSSIPNNGLINTKNVEHAGRDKSGREIKETESTNQMSSGSSHNSGSIPIADRSIAKQAQVLLKMNEVKSLDKISASHYLKDAVDFTYHLKDTKFEVHGFDSVNFHIREDSETCVLSFFVDNYNIKALDGLIEKIRDKDGHKEENFI